MGLTLALGVVLSLLTVLVAPAAAVLLADELKAWLPRLTDRLVRRAVDALPEDQRERFAEEWRSDLNETPGSISKCLKAYLLRSAARSICKAQDRNVPSPGAPFANCAHRTFDVITSFTALIIYLPMLVFAAIAIKLETRGPILSREKFVGRDGRIFETFRFRVTPYDSANKVILHGFHATPVGRILRLTSIDELPLLLNVLRGDMAIVGPRAHRPEFAEILREQMPRYDERHVVRPGLTGLAQVNHPFGASLNDASTKLSYDLKYISDARQSPLLTNIQVMARTILVVFTK